jgi:hypothetical protein
MTAPIRSMPELIAALRARRDELQITHATIEDIGLLPDGYVSKVLSDNPMKNIGPKALEGLLDGLGVVLVLQPNPNLPVRVTSKWVKRKRPMRVSASISASMPNEVPAIFQITPELERKLVDLDHMKRIAKMGVKRRNKIMGKRARQRAASHAARIRWAKRLVALAAP